MWILSKTFRFEAAHRLPRHDGKCARLHGHSWQFTVKVGANALRRSGSKTGMAIDYGDIKAAVAPLLREKLDHHYLNETTELENPTSEEIARFIYEWLEPKLPGLVAVVVNETCTSSCTYSPSSERPFDGDEIAVG